MTFFFFNDTATTEIYTLSLHDALPIYREIGGTPRQQARARQDPQQPAWQERGDRKSTRLNSSHGYISYAVFCLKKNTGGGAGSAGSPSSHTAQSNASNFFFHPSPWKSP